MKAKGRTLRTAVALTAALLLATNASGSGMSIEERIETLRNAEVPKVEQEMEREIKEVTGIIFYGDSRVVGMGMTCSGNAYVGKVSMGYDWMAGSGLGLLLSAMEEMPDADVVFCFGVNDPGNVYAYADWFRSFCDSHPDRRVWFESVNPINDGIAAANGYFANDGMVRSFNEVMSAAVPDRYIDTYTPLVTNGYGTPDGIHYDGGTYSAIQDMTRVLITEKING